MVGYSICSSYIKKYIIYIYYNIKKEERKTNTIYDNGGREMGCITLYIHTCIHNYNETCRHVCNLLDNYGLLCYNGVVE